MLKLIKNRCNLLLVLAVSLMLNTGVCAQSLDTFAEFGTTIYAGDYVPLWQNSLQHGFSSLKNNTYLRGGVFYKDTINEAWRVDAGVDLGVAYGFESVFMLQQGYADVRYKWIGAWAGLREIESPLLNQELSSGGLTWSGNARPIPQIALGVFDYVYLWPWLQFKAELSYGWFTDGKYLQDHRRVNHQFVKKVKYHHKSFFFKIAKPQSKWSFDVGMTIDDQFGGLVIENGVTVEDLGSGFKDYISALIPMNGGEGEYFNGNYLGSEHFKVTYKDADYTFSAYLENYFDDLSGMGKQNGMDGLWGIEFKTTKRQAINGMVLEYFQSTHQSGPLHGLDFSDATKTGGADDYYNHFYYAGWSHWGMGLGTPLIASPLYNADGDLRFLLNRVKAVHLAWKGDFARDWSYRAKMTFNRTWGTPFKPTLEVLDNFSGFVEFAYFPHKLEGWGFKASAAFDTGSIYGDNIGFQLKVRKRF